MEPITTAALIGGGISAAGSLLGAGLGWGSANSARALQEELANTAIQRRVRDMRAAGINPILAAGSMGGADSPNPAVASPSIDTSGLGDGVQSAARLKYIDKVRVGNESRATDAQVATAVSTQEVNSANAAKAKVEAAVLAKEVDNKVAHKFLTEAQTALTHATAANVRADYAKKEVQSEAWSGAKGVVQGIKDSALGKALSGTWKYWTSPSQNYAAGRGNVNGGLHSAHQMRRVRELGASHRRGADLGARVDYGRVINRNRTSR